MSRVKKATSDSKSIEIHVSEVAETSKRSEFSGNTQKKDKKLVEMDVSSSSDVDSEDESFAKSMFKIKLNVSPFQRIIP